MDDLGSKLQEILGDPGSMERVRQMAQSLLGDGDESKESDADTGTDALGGADIGKMMNVLASFQNREADNRTKLLLALKQNLTGKRREKVDSAIKLLKLVEALPLLKEAGIFDLG
ncbi:MAG: hypothetical protein IKZ47_06265 [Clostridia bacterium]|nr:hypothetical protein [Clostridia bacterium]